jgi:hypothetical protein
VRGCRTILVGDSGHGKTTLALQMVAGIVRGDDVLGHRGAGSARALLVDLEQGVRSVKRGLRESGLADRDDVYCVLCPEGLALDSEDLEHLAELDRVIAETMPAVVVLDPFYKAHQADDPNAERPVVDLMRRLDALRSRHGFALILPAHPRKQTVGQNGVRKLTLHDVAGSGAIVRGAEVVLGIERGNPGYSRLRYLKDRDGDLPVGEAVPLLFTRGEGFRLDEREAETEEQLAMRALEAGSDHVWRTLREWKTALEVGEKKARELLDRLTDERLFEYAEGPPGRARDARCWRVPR